MAIATNGHYLHEVEAVYEPGQTRVVCGHEITYLSTEVVQEEHREATKVRVQVDGGQVYEPALSQYPAFGRLIGTPSVKTGLTEDVYLTVTRLPDEGSEAVTLRVIIQPMALWLWIGGGVMALGTVLAAWPGRHRRRPTDPVSAPIRVDAPVEPEPEAEPVGTGDRRTPRRRARHPPGRAPHRAGGVAGGRRCSSRSSLLCSPRATAAPSAPPQSPLIGEVAPATEGETIDGERVLRSTDQRGRWVVLNFFASWCIPCLEEHPELLAFDAAHRVEGDAVLVSVTFDDTADKARDFFERARRRPGPSSTIRENSIGVAYGVAQVPETFVISPERHRGAALRGRRHPGGARRAHRLATRQAEP